MDNYCPNCGLEYRQWAIKIEEVVCEECEPLAFGFLHNRNIGHMKRRLRGQEHITEFTWFPTDPKANYDLKDNKYHRRTQK